MWTRNVQHPAIEEDSDGARLARIGRGDLAALRELHERHGPWIRGYAQRMLGDAHEAEEVVQDVFVRVWKRAGEYDKERASPRGWMAMLAHRISVDRLRRRSRRPDLTRADGELILSTVPSASGHPARFDDVNTLLSTLRPVERSCLEHMFLEGLTHAETAIRTGLPIGTVKTHLRRALQRLRATVSHHDS